MPEIKTQFAQNLKLLIDEFYNGNVSAAARAMELDRTTMNRLIYSEKPPGTKNLLLVCEHFSVDARVLNERPAIWGMTVNGDALPCECGSKTLAPVEVRDEKTWHRDGVAVACFNCGARGTPRPSKHGAVKAWNAAARASDG